MEGIKGFIPPFRKWVNPESARFRTTPKLSEQRHETETKQFQNSFETVLKLFCFSFVSLCGQFNSRCCRFPLSVFGRTIVVSFISLDWAFYFIQVIMHRSIVSWKRGLKTVTFMWAYSILFPLYPYMYRNSLHSAAASVLGNYVSIVFALRIKQTCYCIFSSRSLKTTGVL